MTRARVAPCTDICANRQEGDSDQSGTAGGKPGAQPKAVELLNVSYDPTRELYEEFNAAFAKSWQAKTGQTVMVKQSHGGSGKQARAVADSF